MDPVKALVYRAVDFCKRMGAQRGKSNRSKVKNNHKHVEKRKKAKKAYYEKHKTATRKKQAEYRDANRVKVTKQSIAINKKRRKEDPVYRMACRLRTRIGNHLRSKGFGKKGATFDQIGLSPEDLSAYLGIDRNSQLSEHKHIDHIFPLFMFDVEDGEQQKKVMHFSNLQVLTEHENECKSNRLPTKAMASKVEKWAWPEGIQESDLPDVYEGWTSGLRK
jgi:hypothetical protein